MGVNYAADFITLDNMMKDLKNAQVLERQKLLGSDEYEETIMQLPKKDKGSVTFNLTDDYNSSKDPVSARKRQSSINLRI